MSQYNESKILIERAALEVTRAQEFLALVTQNAMLIDCQEGKYGFVNNALSERIDFDLSPEGNFEVDLHNARAFMRKVFGSWNDEFKSTWNPYGNVVIVAWRDPKHKFELWMHCTLETFPKSLYPSEGCSWVTSTCSSTTKALVCGVSQ